MTRLTDTGTSSKTQKKHPIDAWVLFRTNIYTFLPSLVLLTKHKYISHMFVPNLIPKKISLQ